MKSDCFLFFCLYILFRSCYFKFSSTKENPRFFSSILIWKLFNSIFVLFKLHETIHIRYNLQWYGKIILLHVTCLQHFRGCNLSDCNKLFNYTEGFMDIYFRYHYKLKSIAIKGV